MENTKDLEFEDFVYSVLNITFSSSFSDIDSDNEELLLNNTTDENDNMNIEEVEQNVHVSTSAQPYRQSPPTLQLVITPPQILARPSNTQALPNYTVWSEVTDNDASPTKTICLYNINHGPNTF